MAGDPAKCGKRSWSRRRNRPAFFSICTTNGVRREHGRLSVGAASLAGRTNGVGYLTLAAADGQNCSVALMFIMPSTRAEKYRQEAARLRFEAERAKHPDIRRQLLNIAMQYDDLANSVEPLLQSN